MEGPGLEGSRSALSEWFNQLQPGDSAALLSFDSRVQVLQDLTTDRSALENASYSLHRGQGSHLYDGFAKGIQLLQNRPGTSVLVFVSDGEDSGSYFKPPEIEQMLLKENIILIGIGIGNSENLSYRRLPQRSGGIYYSVSDADEIILKSMEVMDYINGLNPGDSVQYAPQRKSSSMIPSLVIESTPLNSAVFIDNIFAGFTADQPSRGSDHSNQLRLEFLDPGEHDLRIVTLSGDVFSMPDSFEFSFRMGNMDAYINATVLMRRATLIHSNGRREQIQPDALMDIQQSLDKFDRMFE